MRYQGKISKWNDAKGFGFVTPNGGGQAVFIHVRAFSNRQRRPLDNALVSYELGSDARGRCCAIEVRYANEKPNVVVLWFGVLPMVWMLSFVAVLAGATLQKAIPMVIGMIYLSLSLITFLLYALDKSAAEGGRWRRPENTLLLFGLMGGWPGAIFAQQLLRHKSSKREFQSIFWVTVLLNCAALIWMTSSSGTDVRALLGQII